jgi:hypothetical protein
MANNSIRLENAKDQSVVWDETGITTTSLSNPSEIVRIVSGGIFLSTDGGVTWNTGITGSGMNANFITTGQINTSVVNIMNGSFPSFRWDSKGLSAFAFSTDATGKAYGFNTAKFVRYDQYGLYGIDGITGFEPKSNDDIWNNAKFALTWEGFMLKNKYGNGYVSISSTDDFLVSDGTNQRIKIGNLGDTVNPIYGIRISNATGAPVMETDDSGELWLKNRLRVGTNNTSTVEIGYLDAIRAETDIHEVIHAGDFTRQDDKPFIVYEDGRVVANYIEANGGRIGNMSIETIEQIGYEVIITSNIGNIIKEGTPVELSASLYLNGIPYVPKNNEEIKYQWYDENGVDINGATSNQYVTEPITFNNGYVQYGCKITVSSKEE